MSYKIGASFSYVSAFGNRNEIPIGYNGGIEIGYYPSGSTAFIMNFNIDRLKSPDKTEYYQVSEDAIEITIGPRIYLNDRQTFFVEGSVGSYMFGETIYKHADWEYPAYRYSKGVSGFGFAAGFGKDVIITSTTTLSLMVKFHGVLTVPESPVYMGMYSALSFNNKNSFVNEKKSKSQKKWSITLLGGFNNPDFFYNNKYRWDVSFGAETAYRFFPMTEYYFSVMYNKFSEDQRYTANPARSIKSLEFTMGPRFIFTSGKLTPFLETGIGLYNNYLIKKADQIIDNNSLKLGINFGTGLQINIYKSINLIAKSKLNFLFNNTTELAHYFAASSGVRLDL
jgi:hypothetical protein